MLTDLLIRVSDWPIPRPDPVQVSRKNPAAPQHARLTNDALALMFLWGVLTIGFGLLGIAIAAASVGSPSHSVVVRIVVALLATNATGVLVQGARFEWNSLLVALARRRRARKGTSTMERHVHWPTRPGDLDLVIQLAAGVAAAFGCQPR